MPSKKKKYNARFPAGRIKKIMQSDEEIGKVAQAVPVIISRTLELFVESLLTKTIKITNSRNAKTLSTSHMKQCIMSEQRFDFLRELVKNIPDISVAEEASNYNDEDAQSSPEEAYPDSDTPYDLSMPSTSMRATRGDMGGGSSSSISQLESNYNGGDGHSTAKVGNRQHLKRGISTVIMHTNAVAHEYDCAQGTKFMRSDSTPVAVVPPPRQRLKHQPQSLPIHNNNNNNNNYNNNGSGNYNYNTECLPSKRSRIIESTVTPTHTYTTPAPIPPPPSHQQQLQKQPQTAIPAPIVSFDFRNKPIVKIDYSNLPMPTAATVSSPIAPHSAPANTGATQCDRSAFNFSAEPVINIDLSNIVTTNINEPPLTVTTKKPAAANGAPPTMITVKPDTVPTPATSTSDENPKSKVTMQAPFNTNSCYKCVPAANASAAAAANKNSFFELDEDYDDI